MGSDRFRFGYNMPITEGPSVYRIVQASTGRAYIGSSERTRRRIYEHHRYLKANSHSNVFLQRAWNASSPEDFSVEVVREFSESADARKFERELIIESGVCNPVFGFNLMTPNENGVFKHSQKTREKLSAILIGHKRNVGKHLSDAHKASISAAQKGKVIPRERVEKVANALRGRPANPEAVAKRAAALKGLPKSAEWRQKVSEAAKKRGTPTWMIEAARVANTGRKQTAEHKAAILEGKRKAKALREAGL